MRKRFRTLTVSIALARAATGAGGESIETNPDRAPTNTSLTKTFEAPR